MFSIVVELFDCVQAEAFRRSNGAHISARPDPLSLDTLTGLPASLDLKARQCPARLQETTRLFDCIESASARTKRGDSSNDSNSSNKALDPRAASFQPGSPQKAALKEPVLIKPLFTPLRKLDYRFSKISIDWQDMLGGEILKGSIDAGFGIIHLQRDSADIENGVTPSESLQVSDGRLLAVLAIPSVMNINDFLFFVEPAAETISQIRILRDEMPNKCMALLQFYTATAAADFKDAFHGQPFWQMFQDEICQVVPVSSVEVRSTIEPPFSSLSSSLTSSAGQTMALSSTNNSEHTVELPTCVVCLERMDANITGLITIPCQHTFHCSCLSKWANGKCPVCRYTQSKLKTNAPFPENTGLDSAPTCDECGVGTSLWMCLICGHVGCGRYGGKHGVAHYKASSHNYAMELETQRVWDYLGDAYVHRLIQNRTDGQLVELPSMKTGGNPSENEHNGAPSKQQLGPDTADIAAQEKLERMGEEFSHVLSSQLETQRSYYADKLAQSRDEMAVFAHNLLDSEEKADRWRKLYEKLSAQSKEGSKPIHSDEQYCRLEAAHSKLSNEFEDLQAKILPNLSRDKLKAESKVEESLTRSKQLAQDLAAEKAVTAGLMLHVDKLKVDLQAERSRTTSLSDEMRELRTTVEELSMHIAMSGRIQASNDPDVVNSDLIVQPRCTVGVEGDSRTVRKKKKKPKKPPGLMTQGGAQNEVEQIGDEGK